ncbi:MAG: hypothetical protein AB1736_00995 [Chloroflexota bacterium]
MPVRIGPARQAVIGPLAMWLLAAVGLDLVVTRFVVRLAIFVPKGEPFATAGTVLGRIGAAADALVPIMAILLLGALLARAGRTGGRLDRAILVAIAVVAVGGLALVVHPPTPDVIAALDLLAGSVALFAGARAARDARLPLPARLGLAWLAISVGASAVASAGGGSGLVQGADDHLSIEGIGPAFGAIGQVAFVVGGGLVGLAGVLAGAQRGARRRHWVAAGLVAGTVVAVVGTLAPATWAALTTWSIGLTGIVPTVAVALAAGLAIAGLPALHERSASAAIGAGIVLLAGHGLAASGLVLASLLGLVVAGIGDPDRAAHEPRRATVAALEGSPVR